MLQGPGERASAFGGCDRRRRRAADERYGDASIVPIAGAGRAFCHECDRQHAGPAERFPWRRLNPPGADVEDGASAAAPDRLRTAAYAIGRPRRRDRLPCCRRIGPLAATGRAPLHRPAIAVRVHPDQLVFAGQSDELAATLGCDQRPQTARVCGGPDTKSLARSAPGVATISRRERNLQTGLGPRTATCDSGGPEAPWVSVTLGSSTRSSSARSCATSLLSERRQEARSRVSA